MARRSDSETGTRRGWRGGFTLVELLVAMVVAAIVMYGVYILYEKSSSAFRVQNQLTELHQQLRFGVEFLKRDLERAGFLATSNSTVDGDVCMNAAERPLRGVIIHRDAEEGRDTTYLPVHNANLLPASVTLFGDFWSPGPFRVFSIAGNQLVLDGSFWFGNQPFPTPAVLAAWFPAGRLVRLVTPSGWELYLTVQALVPNGGGPPGANWPILVVGESVPVVYTGDACGVMGVGTGAQVNPVGYIRYRIARDTRSGAPAGKYDLIREELNPVDLNLVVPQSQLTIAENAVDLQFYDFIFDETMDRTTPWVTRVGNSGQYEDVTRVVESDGIGGRLSADEPTADPHRLRALTFKLSVRTPDEDANLAFKARVGRWDRLTVFEVDPLRDGAARVRSLSSRVVLSNFLTRNLLP